MDSWEVQMTDKLREAIAAVRSDIRRAEIYNSAPDCDKAKRLCDEAELMVAARDGWRKTAYDNEAESNHARKLCHEEAIHRKAFEAERDRLAGHLARAEQIIAEKDDALTVALGYAQYMSQFNEDVVTAALALKLDEEPKP